MEKRTDNKYPFIIQEGNEKKIILPGYPSYPEREGIYNQGKEEEEINPEQVTLDKENEIVVESKM